jgi:aminoglycoside phosphotransferase (APT) family kinase protein
MVMTRVPAYQVGFCIDILSDAEVEVLIRDLRKFVAELRAITRAPGADGKISNATGEACFDQRINLGLTYDEVRGDFVGPFANEDEFNDFLTNPRVPGVRHRSGHPVRFTHGDLNMRNIMMENGKLSGVIDWETSGWYPEYWDYTKARFAMKLHKRWLDIVDRVFSPNGEFDAELETERKFWEYCCL